MQDRIQRRKTKFDTACDKHEIFKNRSCLLPACSLRKRSWLLHSGGGFSPQRWHHILKSQIASSNFAESMLTNSQSHHNLDWIKEASPKHASTLWWINSFFFLKNFDFIKSHRNQERYWIDKENNLCCLGKCKNTGIGRRKTANRWNNNTGSILSDNSASSFGIITLILYS